MPIEGLRRWARALGPRAIQWLLAHALVIASILLVIGVYAFVDWKTQRDYDIVRTQPSTTATLVESWCGKGCELRIEIDGKRYGLAHDSAHGYAVYGEHIEVVADPLIPRRYLPVADSDYWECATEVDPWMFAGIAAFVVLIVLIWALFAHVFTETARSQRRVGNGRNSSAHAENGPTKRPRNAINGVHIGVLAVCSMIFLTGVAVSVSIHHQDNRHAKLAASGDVVQGIVIGWSEFDGREVIDVEGERYILMRGHDGPELDFDQHVSVVYDPEDDEYVIFADPRERWLATPMGQIGVWGLPPAIGLGLAIWAGVRLWPSRSSPQGRRAAEPDV
ncbi:hypothetical protein BJH93_08135 [Kocuria polaris]|nr:hypothetical protein [Kocuria polaris]